MIELSTDPVAFDARAGELVRARVEATVLATVLQGLLDRGTAERVVLYTDLSNPTSNRIYADVGYRRIADFEEHELV